MSFEIGDVVQLKSGGEKMTVEGITDGRVTCVWQTASETERETFDERLLERDQRLKISPRRPQVRDW